VDAVNSLAEFWRAMPLDGPPYIHPKDKEGLSDKELDSYFDTKEGLVDFDSFVRSRRFGDRNDNRFYTSLLPGPYAGSIERADIFILMLNPGFEYVDYFAEYRDEYHGTTEFKAIRSKTNRQELGDVGFPFFYLNPEFCWHSGFMYWERKLRPILETIANDEKCGGYFGALKAMSQRFATLQLVPYHSRGFSAGSLITKLPSTKVMIEYVKDQLVPSAKRGEKTLIVTRKAKEWGIEAAPPNIVVYGRNQARGAHLGPDSDGGQAILRQFQKEISNTGVRT
jgi:hypothetical protein